MRFRRTLPVGGWGACAETVARTTDNYAEANYAEATVEPGKRIQAAGGWDGTQIASETTCGSRQSRSSSTQPGCSWCHLSLKELEKVQQQSAATAPTSTDLRRRTRTSDLHQRPSTTVMRLVHTEKSSVCWAWAIDTSWLPVRVQALAVAAGQRPYKCQCL